VVNCVALNDSTKSSLSRQMLLSEVLHSAVSSGVTYSSEIVL